MKLIVTRTAEADLESIGRYSIEQWGHDQAITYARGLLERFDEIAANPALAKLTPFAGDRYRQAKFESHMIYVLIDERTVRIVRILHQRMDQVRHLP